MIRNIFKCHGGKFHVRQFVISNMPNNYVEMTYVEPFAGSCVILLNKEISRREIVNDIDKEIFNLIYTLKTDSNSFMQKLNDVQYTLETFLNAKDKKDPLSELIKRRMSRGGMKQHFSWSERLRGGRIGDVNAFETFKEHLPIICERLKNVEVRNENALDLIQAMDSENVLFYNDPPYLPSTRSAPKVYDFEMTEKDHIALADILNNIKGKALLSGYPSALYNKMYKDWNMEVKEMANHSSQSKKKERRLECLWKNY